MAYAGKEETYSLADKNAAASKDHSLSTAVDTAARGNESITAVIDGADAAYLFNNTVSDAVVDREAKVETIETLFGCDVKVSTAYQANDTTTGKPYTRYICEDSTEVYFDEHGDIFKISTIYADDTVAYSANTVSVQAMQSICLDMMPDLYDLFGIDTTYSLTETYDFDDDFVFFTFENVLPNGVVNPYQSINIVFDKKTLDLSIAVRFDYTPNAIEPVVSAENALAVARTYTSENVVLADVSLTYISDLLYSSVDAPYYSENCYLVYSIAPAGGNDILYVDALTGEYVGRNMEMGEEGFSVAILESNLSTADNYNSDLLEYSSDDIRKFNSWFSEKARLAASAMGRLGYTATSSTYYTYQMYTDVREYLQALNNEYAFFFSGHGGTERIGFKKRDIEVKINTSDVTGNWHFVFLDACKTALDTGWADAFKIRGYSNRAFLGWSASVNYDNMYLFAQEFWPLINGRNTVRQAAVDAAAEVPGSGTTPIRFYGDTTYTGEAWT